MSKTAVSLLIMFVFLFAVDPALACTTFCLKNKGEILFGKNYDWSIGDGMIFVNKRGMSKTSSIEGEKAVATWTSKYGSVTFNQYGWEQPSGGMNEVGVVIELMWLDEGKYPKPDDRPAIDVLEWIQYELDTSASTAEAIANSNSVRIASKIPLHYLVSDREGKAATIEFLDGKLVAHTGIELPIATLTNDTYARSMRYAAANDSATTRSTSSLDRFVRTAAKTKEFGGKELSEESAVNFAFDTLANAAQPGYTQWSIVYDQKRMKVHFRTKDRPEIKTIDAHYFDYGCVSPVIIFDLNATDSGDISPLFKPYTRAANRNLIERAFNGTEFLAKVPSKERDAAAEFPERFTCSSVQPLRDKMQTRAENAGYEWATTLAYIFNYLATSR
jgi:choloylglycine hydrolase